ncbi:hypothetical protein [Nitratireductor rhodophyticola]|uniref:hypothetical protein n=1 Tax=Nitratireductor rhodophyticola TaxID=2854036 RepID=UPI003BA96901
MFSIADYNKWKSQQQNNSVGAANIVLGSIQEKPDEVAGDLNLANDFGKVTGGPVPPRPVVKEYRNIFQQRIEQERNKTILSSSPRLTDWLRNPENAALARDDLEGLSWWETVLGAGGNAVQRGTMRIPQSANQFMAQAASERAADQRQGIGGILSERMEIRDGSGEVVGSRLLPGPDDLFWAGSRYLTSRLSGLFGGDQTERAQFYQQRAGEIANRIAAIPMSPAGERYKQSFMSLQSSGDIASDLGKFLSSVADDPGGFLSFLTETAAESAPSIASATAITALTRSPAVGATVLGGYSGAVEAGVAPVEFFAEHGVDVSTPEGALAAITNRDLMQAAAERGLTRGVIIGVMDGLSGGVAGQRLANSEIGNLALQSVVQAMFGAGGEAGAQIASGQEFNIAEVMLEGLAEFVTAPVEVAGVGGRGFLDATRKARDAEARKQLFEELSGQAQASALRGRMPDKFREFVERATANGPVENVFVPAGEFVTYFQSNGVDPFAIIEELDGVTRDDLDAALAGGGDLKIPTATYAAKIAGGEHDAFLMENMRFDPDEFTASEAAQFNERAQEAMQEAYELAEELRQQEEELRTFEQEIYDTMVSRLRSAGRSTDIATTEAMLYPAFYRVMAERSQMTVDEFMAQYPLPRVEGERPKGLRLRDTDALNRTLAEARARRESGLDRRQTLLEFIADYGGINDVGGELRARDAETIKRGRGKKTLKLSRGRMSAVRDMFGGDGRKFGMDDVAAAAIEAGFMADNPTVIEYRAALENGDQVPDIGRALLEAIDQEIAGNPQFSANDAVDQSASEREAALDEIEEYLASIGVSLDDDDATIRAALDEEREGEGRQYGQSGGPGPRGSIRFPAGGIGKGETIVQLFQSADLSTFVHESGHYFLTVMQDLAARGEKSAVDDFAAVKSWWRDNAADVAKDGMRVMHDVTLTADDVVMAIEAGSTGNVLKDAAIDVGMQEQWARAFEAYLMEGKAPSADLRSAFEKFRAWLISIYRNLAGLNVKPSDELRQVFDRMLASDEEIAKAQAKAGGDGPLFATAEEMGLTQEEYDGFLKLRAQAEDDAKSRLLKEALAPIKREREKWFKEERAKVRDEVEREVNAYRYFRAIEWMGNRRWLGDDQPEDMPDIRMSKSILVERYGDGVLKTLPRGRQTVYAVEGGIDTDDAAGWFGFDSGDEMVKAMEAAPARKEAIEAETDKIMRERHGDVLNDGSAEVEALAAVHGDKRGQWIAAELKAVAEVAGVDVAMTAKEARASARETLSRMRVRDATAANRFLSAERKAGEEAARLGAMLAREGVWMGNARRRIATKARGAMRGDGTANAVADQIEQANRSTGNYNDTVSRLIQAKRRQLLNHALYAESRKVIEEVEKAERYVGRLNKKSKREKIAGAGRRENASIDYLSAIDEIMERYDFRKMSGAAENRRGALNAFVEAMKAAGRENEIAIPDSVLAEAARAPYKTIAVEELRGVIDSLKNLEHVALRWNSLIDAEKQRKLDEVVAEISEAFDKNIPKRPPGRVGSTAEALRNTGRQFLDMVLNATTILREIDGFADFGAAYRNIKAPIDEAMNRLIVRKEKAAADIDGLYAVYSKEERRRMAVREHIPELGYALSKWERIAVALNTGNEGNYARLTDRNVRGSLTEAQVSAVLASLNERDARFVQSVWDYVGSFRPDIAARERRATGVEPQWVEAKPVTIAGVELKGGYYPIKYDPRLSSLARDDEAQDIAQSLQAGRFGKAQTKNGHLKERAKSSGRDVELDMSVLHRHVNQVIYDIELSEAVSNSWRILQDGRVRGAFMDAGKQADFDALETWLKDVAEGELRSADFVGRAARMLKSNFTAAKLAFNLSTVAVQLTGLPQTMVVVGKRDFVRGVRASFQPGAVSEIGQKSAFMASRQTTFNKDIYDFYSDPRTGPVASRWGDIKREIVGPVSFWLMTKVQYYLVDVPTWLAGYQQGLRRFKNDEAKAIAHADSIVKRAQASGLFSDRSAVERGSVSRTARQNDVVRLFTALGSYMFAKFNVAYERTAVAGRTVAEEGLSARSAQEALSWTVDMAFLFTVEAVLYAAIKGRLPDEEDEDDEGWTAFLAKETAFSVMSTIPFVRDVGSTMSGFEGGGAYGAITKEFAAPFAQASQGEADPALVKSIINATGLVTGAPSTQINRAVDAAWRQAEGDDVSPLEYLLGRFGK